MFHDQIIFKMSKYVLIYKINNKILIGWLSWTQLLKFGFNLQCKLIVNNKKQFFIYKKTKIN